MPRDWPQASGQLAKLIRRFDWSQTEVGPLETWPQSLRMATDLMLRSSLPMTILWGTKGVMIYNDGYSVVAGGRHPAILGSSVLESWPEVADFNTNVLKVVLAGRSLFYRDQYFTFHRNGVAENVWLNLDYSPVLSSDGKPLGVFAIVIETTARVMAERRQAEAQEELRAREAELARVQEIGQVGGLEVDLRDGFRNKRSPEYLRVHGLPSDAMRESHEDWVRRIHPDDRVAVEAHFREAVASKATRYTAEYRIIRPSDGEMRWISATAVIEREPDGKPVRLVGTHIDITERKEAETQQRLLMQELTHRVRNTLSLVQAIVSQTLRNAQTIDEARTKVMARISALSQANDVLLRNSWTKSEMRTLLEAVIDMQGDAGRFDIAGPSVMLGPKAALSLTLILHELTTNAVKYGALFAGTPNGRVSVTWDVSEEEGGRIFHLKWQESGGPTVNPPTRSGFGTRLIERSFPSGQSRSEITYPPDGVVFNFRASVDLLQEANQE